jgi:hypothetical protein
MAHTILHSSYSVSKFPCKSNCRLQRYIRDAVLRAAAIALKRLSLSLTFKVTPQILSLVQNLAEKNSSEHSVLSCIIVLMQKIVYISCLTEYLNTFISSQSIKHTTFHLPLEQHIHSKSQLDSHILQPLWITLNQVLEICILQPPSDNSLIQKTILCCATIISWDFGIEEGTFRRVSFGPATAVDPRDDEEDDEKQPIWPGSWGHVINEFVVELFFKVSSFQNLVDKGLCLDAKCVKLIRK